MNYRHAFHAGNFADVIKHAILCRVLVHLREKPAAFRVIDTHAGTGRYNLAGAEAGRTQEWQGGIGRLANAELAAPVRALLAPYLDAVAALNPGGRLAAYPGSPLLAQALMRRQDRLIACELEPRAAALLRNHLDGDNRCKAITIDGWTALSAYVPPTERRGMVLVDPPFEQPDEFARLAQALAAAHRKWPTGTYLLWYPIKDDAEVTTFIRTLTRSAIAKMLRVELILPNAGPDVGLRGSGLIAVNPPWTLHDELKLLLPALAELLSRGATTSVTQRWLTGESAC
ncbi:MAG: 23S rRNA (adenine(2030)-N(6))-methyltransferase RlmJ [Alphaproteobacteria bacterium]|nr:23S rRNA (adenine(2030)-N(6))-methyltransferase RlmJ [Alphaproteobacteria bacterium]